MNNDEQITPGAFRAAYIVVKSLAIYAGVFMLCFYWPQLVSRLTFGASDLRSELVAGVLITPLGFLILGAALGKWHAAMHAILVAIGAAAAWVGVTQLGNPGEEAATKLIAVWTPVILLIYLAGMVLTARRELKEPEA